MPFWHFANSFQNESESSELRATNNVKTWYILVLYEVVSSCVARGAGSGMRCAAAGTMQPRCQCVITTHLLWWAAEGEPRAVPASGKRRDRAGTAPGPCRYLTPITELICRALVGYASRRLWLISISCSKTNQNLTRSSFKWVLRDGPSSTFKLGIKQKLCPYGSAWRARGAGCAGGGRGPAELSPEERAVGSRRDLLLCSAAPLSGLSSGSRFVHKIQFAFLFVHNSWYILCNVPFSLYIFSASKIY